MLLRVLHTIPGLSASSGPTQALLNLCTQQVRLGLDVTVCHVTGRGADSEVAFPQAAEVQGFPAQWLKGWGYSPALKAWLNRKLADVDVVHMHSMWLYPNIAASTAARRFGVPYIVRPAGSLEPWCLEQSRFRKRAYLRLVSRRILDNAACIHAVSRQEAQQIESLGFQSPVVTIPNGVVLPTGEDLDRRERARRLGWPPADRYLLFLSRIHPKKGLDFLLDVFSRIDHDSGCIRLIIAGPDQHEYARQIRQQASAHVNADQIHFVGEVLGEEKNLTFGAADLFVLPSSSENFGIVVLEAMAAGTPVMVTETTPWSVVNDRSAGYCLPLNREQFVTAINAVLSDSEKLREMGQSARSIAEEYSWEAIARENLECYRQLQEDLNR